jgi:hypothetical protein
VRQRLLSAAFGYFVWAVSPKEGRPSEAKLTSPRKLKVRKEFTMNLTGIPGQQTSNRKNLRNHSVSFAAGMTLAISAVVVLGSSTSGSAPVAPGREASVMVVTSEAPYETIEDYAAREQAVLATDKAGQKQLCPGR